MASDAVCEGPLVVEGTRVGGSAALSLVTRATPARLEPALFEAMLAGWRRQQQSRRLSESIIGSRERTVRRFAEFTGGWPWGWSPAQLESWIAVGGWAHSTVRAYQGAVAAFLDYVCDPRYGWVSECEQQLGVRPVQICHEGNTAVHVADYEGRPARRPLTRVELQAFFDAADDRVERVVAAGRKGWLATHVNKPNLDHSRRAATYATLCHENCNAESRSSLVHHDIGVDFNVGT